MAQNIFRERKNEDAGKLFEIHRFELCLCFNILFAFGWFNKRYVVNSWCGKAPSLRQSSDWIALNEKLKIISPAENRMKQIKYGLSKTYPCKLAFYSFGHLDSWLFFFYWAL